MRRAKNAAMSKIKVAVYVTGHGLGHATRVHPVLETLLRAGHSAIVSTIAPRFVYADLVNAYPERCKLRRSVALDPSVVQQDAVTIDVARTFAGLRDFLAEESTLLAAEVEWLRQTAPDIVVVDAPPLPAKVAKLAGIPCIAVTNFTFDYILSRLDNPDETVVKAFVDMYASVMRILQLPGEVGRDLWATYGSVPIEQMPLVARHARRTREEVRHELDLPLDALCLLITFGGFQLNSRNQAILDADTILPDGWYAIFVGSVRSTIAHKDVVPQDDTPRTPGGYVSSATVVSSPIRRHAAALEANGVTCTPADRFRMVDPDSIYLPDAINASDAVLGKCGYGICSEVVAHGVPLLYVRRSAFAEEDGLLDRLMVPYGYCVELSRQDFDDGNWAHAVQKAAEQRKTKKVEPIVMNGAETIAKRIVEIVEEIKSG